MDLVLLEYALWVSLGLWATLFAAHPLARGAGLLLVILAVLRSFTEKEDAGSAFSGPAPSEHG
ncbi:MAG: hypothetical protein AB1645_06675 [Bacillota bacterium]|jgi:hypothetical protein